MKKLILLTVILSCFQVETQASTNIVLKKTSISAENMESKNVVRRRKKKGFLWGLFKKKDCGCPKH
jgi:hypothetical protein